jgi:hypothetical protein
MNLVKVNSYFASNLNKYVISLYIRGPCMKVSELLQEKAGLTAVGAWPPAFLKKVYEVFYLDAKDLPSPEDKKPALKDLKDKIYISMGSDGTYAAMGARRQSFSMNKTEPTGFLFKDGKISSIQGKNMSEMLKEFPKGTYFSLPYHSGGYYKTRYERQSDVSSEARSREAHVIMQYMDEVFLPKLKEKAEASIDRVYANLRKISNKKGPFFYSKSDQEMILSGVKVLEEMMEKGFNRERMQTFLSKAGKIHHGFGSIPSNYYEFEKLMKEPVARAKFAKVMLDGIKALDDQLKEILEKSEKA